MITALTDPGGHNAHFSAGERAHDKSHCWDWSQRAASLDEPGLLCQNLCMLQ
jgi:hypothetical protein